MKVSSSIATSHCQAATIVQAEPEHCAARRCPEHFGIFLNMPGEGSAVSKPTVCKLGELMVPKLELICTTIPLGQKFQGCLTDP